MRARILWVLFLIGLLTSCNLPGASPTGAPDVPPASVDAPPTENQPSTTMAPIATPGAETIGAETHPRLWLTPATVAYYRAWASPSNPVWQQGLLPLAERAKADMDQGFVPGKDCGGAGYEEYATEMYAEFFAFLAQVSPEESVRADYADRAHKLLMFVMNEVAKGPSTATVNCGGSQQFPAFRNPDFYTTDRDRARYHGEAFALAVDWIYPSFSLKDKALIRQVFLQWAQDIVTRGYHHPEPVSLINDPALLADPQQIRFAGNNYFTAHMRNLGMLAAVLNPQDDPDGKLHRYLDNATGAYLYLFNHLIASDARGGVLPEGFEYSPQTASYAAQFLWMLNTSQFPNARQLVDQAFWQDFTSAYMHSISPVPAKIIDSGGNPALAYQPSWYGDSIAYTLSDFIDTFSPLAHLTNNPEQINALRWLAIHTPEGGEDGLLGRISNPDDFRHSILYFLLLDPTAPPAVDPRPKLALDYFAQGLNHIFSRTGWSAGSSWFTFRLGWSSIDHQMADGGHFELFRKGEWLTKGRTGYADIAEGIASSEFYNTVSIANDKPSQDESDWRIDLWKRGSQWNLVNDGNPRIVASSFNPTFAYISGDSTNLYNSTREQATDVVQASRGIVWLKPDHIIVYDRAETKHADRFKRWWLQLAQPVTIRANQAVTRTPGNQQLFVTTLLPANAALQAVNTVDQHITDTTAAGEIMKARLLVEAPGNPASVRFLNVLQGADGDAQADPAALIQSEDSLWQGAVVHGTLILFPAVLEQNLQKSLAYSIPANTTLHIITGLTPGAGYNVIKTGSVNVHVVITPGTQLKADAGGVLMFQ